MDANSFESNIQRDCDSIESIKSIDGEYNFIEAPFVGFESAGKTYKRQQRLGHGAFAYCFLYRSDENDNLVAKVLSKHRWVNRTDVKEDMIACLWEQELNLLRKLNHSHIVRFHGYAEVSADSHIYSHIDIMFLNVKTLFDRPPI